MPPGKRAFDVAFGSLALIVAAPIILIAGLLVRITSPGPALYRQLRIGQDERPFTMLKLRTMRVDTDDRAHREFNTREILANAAASDGVFKIKVDSRITPLGRLLRRYSVDELPQLINVVWGNMSLVGPRPSLPWEVSLYTPEQRRRHECVPGMTGLWQVSGRNHCSMTEMLALDVSYVERRSLKLDLWILMQTPKAVLFDKSVR
jgi:lipopolysaccharide/colanic/teichoic acid biosynthesis glycosyltransferase